jgi:diguanylate cyclase
MNVESLDVARKRMMAQQTVAKINAASHIKMPPHACEALTTALIKSDAVEDLLFRNTPYRAKTPRWTLSGLIARAIAGVERWRARKDTRPHDPDTAIAPADRLSELHYRVRGSGVNGLIIAVMIGLVVGITDFGKPAELGLQIGRDAARRTVASGDIVVIAKDDRSAKAFGGMPWPRRYDAQLVDRLRAMGTKRIVFNQVMADPSNPADDAALAAAFDRAGGKVWLSVAVQKDAVTGAESALLPTPLFRQRTQHSHTWLWFSMFGNVEKAFGKKKIDGVKYPSQAEILAHTVGDYVSIKPDYAIDYNSIPTFSAVDIVRENVGSGALRGKTVYVIITSNLSATLAPIHGQAKVAGGYSLAIAAETLKAGVARELGYALPLLIVALIGIGCVLGNISRIRLIIIGGGTLGLIMLMFAGDRLGLRVDMVPALLALSIFSVREMNRRNVIAAMTTHEISGLPNLAHLRLQKGYRDCAAVALKFERFDEYMGRYGHDEQRAVTLTIAARINIAMPDCTVHQGDNGLFVLLVPQDSEIDMTTLSGQLRMLFTLKVIGLNTSHLLDVSIGAGNNFKRDFETRLTLAIDRAECGALVPLRQVHD